MNYRIAFSAILLSLFVCHSQLEAQYSFQKPKGTYGFVFGFDLGLRIMTENSDEAKNYYSVYDHLLNESSKLSYRIGFNFSRYINNGFYLKSGLRFINPAYNSLQMLALNEADRGYAVNVDSMAQTSYTYRYFFLEVPLHLRYVYANRNCRSFVELGVTTQYYLGTRLTYKTRSGDEGLIKLKEGINPYYFTGVISIGAEFDFNDRTPAFIQLACRYQINAKDKGLVSERLVSLGIEAGTRHYF